ncbi:hypothetical protein FWF74_03635 [Candidatus Saccharibacteria bacterium]|nr:hypothetical protein [Candidatus Saccharibacteria bacterium]MCL1962866.1 hypothetical protein [Candidatus Saccharibacteria bacterium]
MRKSEISSDQVARFSDILVAISGNNNGVADRFIGDNRHILTPDKVADCLRHMLSSCVVIAADHDIKPYQDASSSYDNGGGIHEFSTSTPVNANSEATLHKIIVNMTEGAEVFEYHTEPPIDNERVEILPRAAFAVNTIRRELLRRKES